MMIVFTDGDEQQLVQRKPQNKKMRPEPQIRFNIDDHLETGQSMFHKDFIESTDFEWLSYNWRKYWASKMSRSSRRTILYMLNNDYEYLPSLR